MDPPIHRETELPDGYAVQDEACSEIDTYEMSILVSQDTAGQDLVLEESRKSAQPFVFVVLASCTAALGGILFGYDIGVISGALLQLQVEFHLSCTQQAMIVSSLLIGATLGSIIAGILVDYCGRRLTITMNAAVFVLGALALSLAPSAGVLMAGRIILGIAIAVSAVAECVYISEIAPAKRRGLLVSLNELGITLGILLSFLANFFFLSMASGWRYMFGLSIIPAIFQGAGMIFMPASPRYLMLKGKETEAANVLKKLHGQQFVKSELKVIRSTLATEHRHSIKDLCKTKNMLCRLLLGIGLVFFQQFTGQPNLLYYAPTVFKAVGFPSDSAAILATLGLGSVKVVAAIVSLLCVDFLGRRTFLIGGALMMCTCLTTLGIEASLQGSNLTRPICQSWLAVKNTSIETGMFNRSSPENTLSSTPASQSNMTPAHPQKLSVSQPFSRDDGLVTKQPCTSHGTNNTCLHKGQSSSSMDQQLFGSLTVGHMITLVALMIYVGSYGVSFGPISWIILSEIYPPEIRGRAVAFVTILNWGANFVVSSTFLDLTVHLGVSGSFFLYGALTLLSSVFVFVFIPETKNKSLEKISEDLSKGTPWKKLTSSCSPCLGCHDNQRSYMEVPTVEPSSHNSSTSHA